MLKHWKEEERGTAAQVQNPGQKTALDEFHLPQLGTLFQLKEVAMKEGVSRYIFYFSLQQSHKIDLHVLAPLLNIFNS